MGSSRELHGLREGGPGLEGLLSGAPGCRPGVASLKESRSGRVDPLSSRELPHGRMPCRKQGGTAEKDFRP